MNDRLSNLLNIKPENFWFFRYFFFFHFWTGISLAFAFTAAYTLFLAYFSAANLLVVFALSAGILLLAGRLYAYVSQAMPMEWFHEGLLAILGAALLLGYVFGGHFHFVATIFSLVVAYRVGHPLMTIQSWGISSVLFDFWRTKSASDWIRSADLPGRFLGFLLVPFLLNYVEVRALFLFSFVGLFLSWATLRRLFTRSRFQSLKRNYAVQPLRLREEVSSLRSFLINRYTLPLVIVSVMVMVYLTLLEYQFYVNIQQGLMSEARIAVFLGVFFSAVLGLGMVLRLVFRQEWAKRLSLANLMLILPLSLLVLVGLLNLGYRLGLPAHWWTIAILCGVFLALKYSFFNPIQVVLLQPFVQRMQIDAFVILQGLVNPLGILMAVAAMYFAPQYLPNWQESQNWALLLLALTGGWLLLVVVSRRQYREILKHAVQARLLEGNEEVLASQDVMQIIEDKIRSAHSEEVIYAVELLNRVHPERLGEFVPQLFAHPSEEIKRYVLDKIQENGILESLPFIIELINTPQSDEVKEKAIRVACALDPQVVHQFADLLHETQPGIRNAVLQSLVLFGSADLSGQALQQIEALSVSNSEAEQLLFINLIGALEIRQHYPQLLQYLSSDKTHLAKAAIHAAGKTQDLYFAPKLISLVGNNHLYVEASAALRKFGKTVLPILRETFGHYWKTRDSLLLRLCQLTSQIPGKQTYELLCWLLKSPWVELQREAFWALRAAGFSADTKENINLVNERLEVVFRHIFWLYNALELVRLNPQFYLLYQSLQHELDAEQRKCQTLLGYLYTEEIETLRSIQQAISAKAKEERLEGLERLGVKLRASTSEKLFIILDNRPNPYKIRDLQHYYANYLLDEYTVVLTILQGGESESRFTRWTQATALYCLGGVFYPSMLQAFYPYLRSNDRLLAGAAFHTIEQYCQDRLLTTEEIFEDQLDLDQITELMKKKELFSNSLLEIEKVIILKSTSLFADTPEHVLIDIAKIVKEVRVEAGEVIFRKGDIGNCMYIIYEGEIKIHIGNYRLNTLINRDFFGDLGLLDTNPRSASATAERNSLLLRLDQDAFYDLMAQRPEVAKGIVQVLCKRIRLQDSLITDLQQRRHKSPEEIVK